VQVESRTSGQIIPDRIPPCEVMTIRE
jgi:hypothetical protein